MSKRRVEKRITYLEPVFQDVLVCQDKKSQPFIEILLQKPENISQEDLGTLFGIFEITDDSEDSSYIVNYLISVIKKEYFSKPKRGPVESLEAGLHRANLALGKLVEHENINWMGKLNAVCAVLEKNNFHFSQAGDAFTLLLRSKSLTNIGEGMASAETTNPLKTFVDISSGQLEENDKVIISTKEIFDIFSEEEIRKSALRFSQEEFLQFLRTALGNELSRAAVLVFDLVKKEEVIAPIPERVRFEDTNVFSQEAFQKKPRIPQENRQIVDEIKDLLQKEGKEKVDQKTGHIYIKEDESYVENGPGAGEKLGAFLAGLGKIFGSIFKALLGIIIFIPAFAYRKTAVFITNSKNSRATRRALKKEALEKASESRMETQEERMVAPKASLQEKIFSAQKKLQKIKPSGNFLRKFGSALKSIFSFLWKIFQKIFAVSKKIILLISQKLTQKQKLYAGLALIVLIVASIIFVKIKNNSAEKQVAETKIEAPIIVEPEKPAGAQDLQNLEEIYSSENSDIVKVLQVKDMPVIVKKKEIYLPENKMIYAFPENFGELKLATSMDDLRFALLMDENQKIIAFSPISKKFQDNNIVFPAGANIKEIGAYMTYLYAIDASTGQIFRFPRAEGGFGEKVDWMKDPLDVSGISAVAINENLYALYGKNILKFFRGKNEAFKIDDSSISLAPDLIYTFANSSNLYALDKEKSLLVKINPEGKIDGQYFDSELKSALSFAVDEINNSVYFSTADKTFKGGL